MATKNRPIPAQGLTKSWPDPIKEVGGLRTQFHHRSDIVPTILEAAQSNVLPLDNLLDLNRTVPSGPELSPGKHTIRFDDKPPFTSKPSS